MSTPQADAPPRLRLIESLNPAAGSYTVVHVDPRGRDGGTFLHAKRPYSAEARGMDFFRDEAHRPGLVLSAE